jgi:hypothetical protein
MSLAGAAKAGESPTQIKPSSISSTDAGTGLLERRSDQVDSWQPATPSRSLARISRLLRSLDHHAAGGSAVVTTFNGTVGPAFIRALMKEERATLKERHRAIQSALLEGGSDPIDATVRNAIGRVVAHFAVLQLAGEIALSHDILPRDFPVAAVLERASPTGFEPVLPT